MKRVILIIMVVTAVFLGPATAMAADGCQEITATNRQHADAGRAHYVAGFFGCESPGYYAVGSEAFLGDAANTRTTLHTTDNGQSYQLGKCTAQGMDEDADGYPADVDCNDADASIHPDSVETCGDGIDQDCDGADTQCISPPSCIADLGAWKTAYTPKPSECLSCHTRCTYGGKNGVHTCIEGGDWGARDCMQCHRSIHN